MRSKSSHRLLLAVLFLLSASLIFVAASSAHSRPQLGVDSPDLTDSRVVLFHNARLDTRIAPQFHEEPNLQAKYDSDVDQANAVNQYLLHTAELITEAEKKSIEETIGHPLEKYFPMNTWHISTTPIKARALQSMAGVQWVGHYHSQYKLHINVIEGNHNLKLAKYKPVMARLLEANAHNLTAAEKQMFAHHFSSLSASSVHPEGTILGQNPFELFAVLPKWHDDIGQVENLAGTITARLQRDHPALAERVKIGAGSGDLLEASTKNEADLQAVADFLTAQSETYLVTRKSIQRVSNRWARGVSQSDNGNPSYTAGTGSLSQQRGMYGQGQVIGVSDSGLDWQSCFFHDTAFPAGPTFKAVTAATVGTPTADSVNRNHRKVIQYVVWADQLDENGHGTHVSGSIAGQLSQAGNAFSSNNGMSQEAKLAFFDIGRGTAGSLTIPNNYDRTLFPWASVAGAFIHSNSWGSADNTYSVDAAWVDNYMWQNKDFLILVAAGNDGNAPNTIGSPATAKNIVTVGAGTNSKEGWEGMFCNTGYNLSPGLCTVGRNFPNAYDKQHIAGFSSVGPTRDGRLKPDVVAPGMFILSAKNRQTASTSCGGTAATLMAYNAGTSMATPVTAGDVGIIRQWFTEGYYPSGLKNAADGFIPSGSLMKAMLISGSRMLDRYGGNVDAAGYIFAQGVTQPGTVPLAPAPGMVQGYGRVEIDNSLYFQGTQHKTVIFGLGAVAGGRRTEPSFTTTGQTTTFTLCANSVSLAIPVRIAAVWSDAPGQANAANPLVNNLNLVVTVNGQTYRGNGRANTANTAADIRNPNEVVTFDERAQFPAKTEMTITVTAATIARGPQPYTLVATGDVTEGSCTAATAAPTETYVWEAGAYGACSAECTTTGKAFPTQTRRVSCVGSVSGVVADAKCAAMTKPASTQPCNTHPCGTTTYEWVPGTWSACSTTCGGGTQTRTVDCRSIQTGSVVDAANCGDHTKPATIQQCNTQPCVGSTSAPTTAAEWRVGDCPANTCSAQCTCTREISCYYYGVKVSEYLCAPENGGPKVKPPTTVACTGGQCASTSPTGAPSESFSWIASDWGACSVGCTKAGAAGGIQTRTIKCRSSMGYDAQETKCDEATRPAAASACNLDPCPDTTTVKRDLNHQWLMGGWGRCDETAKTQSRWVVCATTNGDQVDAAKCEGHAGPKPAASRACTPLNPYDLMPVATRDSKVVYTWYAERWGDPSSWCGGNGLIYRYAWCLGSDGKVADTRARCDPALKPLEVDKCLACNRPCVASPTWVPGEYWMGCSTVDPCCGEEHRHAFCIDMMGNKIADTTLCGKPGTEQQYFYQSPCEECPNKDKTQCGQFPNGRYPDRGDGPALPGSKVPGAAALPADGPTQPTRSPSGTTPKPATTAAPSTKWTYVRMQANGLRLTGTLTTQAGLQQFLVERVSTYLKVSAETLQVTYFSRTGPDTNARVVMVVAVPAAGTLAKSLLSDLANPAGEIRSTLGYITESTDLAAAETNNPTAESDDASSSSSSFFASDSTKIAIGAGAAALIILAIVAGFYFWQQKKNTAVKHTARMGPETNMVRV